MTDDTGPTLADDEAALARHADALVQAIEVVVPGWLAALIEAHAPGVSTEPQVADAAAQVAADVMTQLRALLARDIAGQTIGPLELLRQAVAFPTAVLDQVGTPVVPRDEFSRTNFPDDVYDLTPASFAAIDPSLHEPGLMWGAAKAHVHLRRRREMPESPPPKVVALSVDLMDRSKLSAAFPDATMVRSAAKLLPAVGDATLVLVDLNRLDNLDVLGDLAAQASGRVVAFGSHVDEEQLEQAGAHGVDALPRSVFFRRLETGQLHP